MNNYKSRVSILWTKYNTNLIMYIILPTERDRTPLASMRETFATTNE